MKVIRKVVRYPVDVTDEDCEILGEAIKIISFLYNEMWEMELNAVQATDCRIAQRDELLNASNVLSILTNAEFVV